MNPLSLSKIERVQLTPTMWASFPDVDKVEPVNDYDYEILNEIREVLEKHNALDRFGVNLIHRHFDMAENEVLLETTDTSKRVQVLKVHDLNSIDSPSNLLETAWVFNGEKGTKCHKTCTPENYGHTKDHIPLAE